MQRWQQVPLLQVAQQVAARFDPSEWLAVVVPETAAAPQKAAQEVYLAREAPQHTQLDAEIYLVAVVIFLGRVDGQ